MVKMMIPDLHIEIMRAGEIETELPKYHSRGASGMDLHAALEKPLTIPPLGRVQVPTGIRVAIPEKFEAQVRPRSGLASKTGLTVLNTPGTIDSDYRGEIKVLLVNLSDKPAEIAPGDRIAQLVFAPVAYAQWRLVERLVDTERGAGGYGSTGK